jgi:hypothetical protein
MKLEFSRQIFEEYFNIKFHENAPNEAELFHVEGQMERWTNIHDEECTPFSEFCERA